MEIEYKISIMSGVYDTGYRMVNSLIDFLNNKDYTGIFDKTDFFTIKKPPHSDGNGHIHFTFSHRGRSYHAYIDQVVTVINGVPMATKFRIKRVTALEIIY